VELEFSGTRELTIRISGDLDTITEASGHPGVAEGFVRQIAVLGSPGKRFDEEASSFALGFVDGMKPRDPAEVALVTQMAAIHQATMMMARRLNHVENIAQQDSAEKALNKLARTYAAQMDTLKRYRSKGQQTVTVQHVNVEDGGQAIVGNVETGGRGSDGT
jgi:hypothetical protein